MAEAYGKAEQFFLVLCSFCKGTKSMSPPCNITRGVVGGRIGGVPYFTQRHTVQGILMLTQLLLLLRKDLFPRSKAKPALRRAFISGLLLPLLSAQKGQAEQTKHCDTDFILQEHEVVFTYPETLLWCPLTSQLQIPLLAVQCGRLNRPRTVI